MKKTLFCVLSFVVGCLCFAQRNPEFAARMDELPGRYGENNHVYEFHPISDTKAPRGYKPFYISHYGRHGSRSDIGGKQYDRLRDAMQTAKDLGLLTDAGDSLLWEASEMARLHDGMNGRLTPLGCKEHERIAGRMFRRYRRVFRRGSRMIRAVSSTSPRCIVSMAAFTNSLSRRCKRLSISLDTGEKFMSYISSTLPDSLKAVCQPWLDSLSEAAVPDTAYVYNLLFTDAEAARAVIPDAGRFCLDIFDTGRYTEAFGLDRNVFRYLPREFVYKRWEIMNALAYMWNGNSKEFGPQRMACSEPLIEDIVVKADEAIAAGAPAADLRFGHDWPCIALAAYLGLEGVGERYDFSEALYSWPGFEYAPFAMNVQMVFYRNRKGVVLVKFLYNEQETLLRELEPVSGPYYSWETVKDNIRGYLR